VCPWSWIPPSKPAVRSASWRAAFVQSQPARTCKGRAPA